MKASLPATTTRLNRERLPNPAWTTSLSGTGTDILIFLKAASLLGARCVLVGISGDTATSMADGGADLSGVVRRGSLQAGIEYALSELGLAVVSTDSGAGE